MNQKIRPIVPPVEKLHKQPRNLQKTYAKEVGRETNQLSLFSLPEEIIDNSLTTDPRKISKNTAILGQELVRRWQESPGEELIIDNLSELSSFIGNSNYETKIYLLHLSGFTYPMIDREPSGGLSLSMEQLFKISFKYGPEVKERHDKGESVFIGTSMAKFIKDEPIDRIIVKPNEKIVKALAGLGLGNVLVSNDSLKLTQGLTETAFKLYNYTASNRPSQKIAEAKLFTHLGLEEQVKKQGKPRVRKAIASALEELVILGHITEHSLEAGFYSFTYSDRFIKHKDHLKE